MNTDKLMELERKWRTEIAKPMHDANDPEEGAALCQLEICADELAAALRACRLEARTHLASRIAELGAEIETHDADRTACHDAYMGMEARATRAEAELAEAQKNTKALYAWIFLALNEGANRITVSPAKFWSVVRANPEIQMRQSPSGDTLQLVAIDASGPQPDDKK